jgi:hypothetical protein
MWFGLMLVCNMDLTECQTFNGPMLPTEEVCVENLNAQVVYIEQTVPAIQVMAYRCETWGEPA